MTHHPAAHLPERSFLTAAFVPLTLTFIMWAVFALEWASGHHWDFLGVEPGTKAGLLGILTMPFVHGDFGHLVSNSLPMVVLGTLYFFYFPRHSELLLLFMWVAVGAGVWLIGRESIHIGASGVVYALAGYVVAGALWVRDRRMLAIFFAVISLYGGLIWGVLPIDPKISWEGHASGLLVGAGTAIFAGLMGWHPKPEPKYVPASFAIPTDPEADEKALDEKLARIAHYGYDPHEHGYDPHEHGHHLAEAHEHNGHIEHEDEPHFAPGDAPISPHARPYRFRYYYRQDSTGLPGA